MTYVSPKVVNSIFRASRLNLRLPVALCLHIPSELPRASAIHVVVSEPFVLIAPRGDRVVPFAVRTAVQIGSRIPAAHKAHNVYDRSGWTLNRLHLVQTSGMSSAPIFLDCSAPAAKLPSPDGVVSPPPLIIIIIILRLRAGALRKFQKPVWCLRILFQGKLSRWRIRVFRECERRRYGPFGTARLA